MTTEPSKIDYREGIDAAAAEVRASFTSPPGPIKDVAELLVSSAGKGARTSLLLACAMDSEGMVPESAPRAAAAIELLHMATLVHDDIIDDAPVRRGVPSVQGRFGKEIAVLAGDWLLTLATRRALEIKTPAASADEARTLAWHMSRTAEKILMGEISQRRHNGNLDLTARQYIRIIDKKTAALFCLAAMAGAELGGCTAREKKALVRFSRYLGVVFQIVDDLKDYTMREGEILKPARRDLVTGVVTMPLIFGLLREPSLRCAALAVIRGEADVAPLVKSVAKGRGIADTRGVASACADKARGIIRDESRIKRDALCSLLDLSLASA